MRGKTAAVKHVNVNEDNTSLKPQIIVLIAGSGNKTTARVAVKITEDLGLRLIRSIPIRATEDLGAKRRRSIPET